MNSKQYTWILYTIITVIVFTISIQIYWNYKNYIINKQQLINDIQISLDNAVDDYYTNLAQKTTFGIPLQSTNTDTILEDRGSFTTLFSNVDEKNKTFNTLDSLNLKNFEGITVFKGFKEDSTINTYHKGRPHFSIDSFKHQINEIKTIKTDLNLYDIEILSSKILMSIENNNLNLTEIDSLFSFELNRKNINIEYQLYFDENINTIDSTKTITRAVKDSTFNTKAILRTSSKSMFLPPESILSIDFSNITAIILKRSLGGILTSVFLIMAVISCLFYLLKIIKQQKQLAEVKNDFISNITHEFKTPIATIGVALESINDFNAIDDKKKTKAYINMSSEQLSKLNIMVEKLLETATLDSKNLELKKESTNIIELINTLVTNYSIQNTNKSFITEFKMNSLETNVDVFHFENAINNILDNAVKYGGSAITVTIKTNSKAIFISISDNGNALTKANKERIFEKFYRVPKGNTHDIKGFGIGLYYTKTIIEKHNGTIQLDTGGNTTTFKISLPL